MGRLKTELRQTADTHQSPIIKLFTGKFSSFYLAGVSIFIFASIWFAKSENYTKLTMYTGKAFIDANANGIWDLGEITVDSIKIWIFIDSDKNGTVSENDLLIDSLYTDEEGIYEWKTYSSKRLVIKWDKSSVPEGFNVKTHLEKK